MDKIIYQKIKREHKKELIERKAKLNKKDVGINCEIYDELLFVEIPENDKEINREELECIQNQMKEVVNEINQICQKKDDFFKENKI